MKAMLESLNKACRSREGTYKVSDLKNWASSNGLNFFLNPKFASPNSISIFERNEWVRYTKAVVNIGENFTILTCSNG